MKDAKWTALYERLSRDDDMLGDSLSIAHQKERLHGYAQQHGFSNCRDYTDDGWSGGTFDRPAWNQMLADIEDGKIDTVIAKDMSRIGRDYLLTGFYTEVYFQRNGVRFIAIDSGVDSSDSHSNEFAPFLNVMNEWYLHDQSKRVGIGFHAKGMSGKPLMSIPQFGYLKSQDDGDRWVIDPEAADTVRRIFALAEGGNNPNRIATILREEKRITPGAYFAQKGQRGRCAMQKEHPDIYAWRRKAVVNLLKQREYLGMTVNFKTVKPSYKAERIQNPLDKQMIFPDTHEAIVDQETWDRAQAMLRERSRPHAEPIFSPFTGKVVCAKCGKPMYCTHYQRKSKTGSMFLNEQFTCSSFQSTSHYEHPACVKNMFSVKILRRLLSDAVHKAAQYAVRHETVFRQQLQTMSVQVLSEEKQLKKAAASAEKRIGELNRLLKKLYEDYALEHIDETNYQRLSLAYEQELSETEQELNQLQEHISTLQESNSAADQFLELAKQYCDASSFTDEELSLFVDKVLVYETQKDADGERTRRLDIHFSFIGEFYVPSEPVILSAEEQKHQEELKKRRIHERNKRAEKRRMREAEQVKHDVV